VVVLKGGKGASSAKTVKKRRVDEEKTEKSSRIPQEKSFMKHFYIKLFGGRPGIRKNHGKGQA